MRLYDGRIVPTRDPRGRRLHWFTVRPLEEAEEGTDRWAVEQGWVSLTPLRRIVKDYYMVCDSYYEAIRTATPDRIEALDMARRALHDEGSQLLSERLKRKVDVDFDTARRLFTLICVLHWKG